MFRRMILFIGFTCLIAAAGIAPAAAEAGEASQFIRLLGNQAIGVLQKPGLSLEQREERFRTILRQGFDLDFIGRFVLGAHWRKANQEQRGDYLQLFGEYILSIYSARLGGYAGEKLTIVSEQPAGKKDVVVRTRIDRPSGPPIKADWRVRTTENRYRIIDIMVAGISMVLTQRSEFSALIKRKGINGLLAVLRARVDKMPATASAG